MAARGAPLGVEPLEAHVGSAATATRPVPVWLTASPAPCIIRPSPMALVPGSTLGPYAIRAQLGSGGMGVVYTAHDPRLDRQVAIKVLPPDLTRDATAKQRFLQEAKAASALDHPNI